MSNPNVVNLNNLDGRYITPSSVDGKIAAQAATDAGQYQTKLQAVIRDSVYIPSATATLKWRQIRTKVFANEKQAHIACLGDSIPYGAAGSGASNPKPQKNFIGRFRSQVNRRYGNAGSGFTLADNNLFSNMAWDPRWAKTGNIVTYTFGPHQASCWRANGSDGATYITFTDTCTDFFIYTLASGGTFTVSLDGGSAVTYANTANGTGGTVTRESGYYYESSSSAQNVYKIPAGSLGLHTIRITPSTNASYNLFLVAVEAIVSSLGTFRVGNMSISGKSLQTFLNTGTGLSDITMLDMLRADILLLELWTNDWQGQRSIASIKTDITTIINRQRSSGVSSLNSTYPNGDVILICPPKPDVSTLGSGLYTNPSWDQYRTALYEIADASDVALIDFGYEWGGTYATANSRGLFADTIHPSDAGADDLGDRLHHILFNAL